MTYTVIQEEHNVRTNNLIMKKKLFFFPNFVMTICERNRCIKSIFVRKKNNWNIESRTFLMNVLYIVTSFLFQQILRENVFLNLLFLLI